MQSDFFHDLINSAALHKVDDDKAQRKPKSTSANWLYIHLNLLPLKLFVP